MEAPTTLHLVRHAQTVWNIERRYAGSSEVPLSAEAAPQIAQLTRALGELTASAIYSSPLSRCQLTILPTAARLGLPLRLTPELTERNLGEWEGRSPSEIELHHGGYRFPESAYDGSFRIPHAEPLDHLEARARIFLDEVRSRHTGESVIAATHAGIIWIILRRIVGNRPESFEWPGNCAHYVLELSKSHTNLMRSGE